MAFESGNSLVRSPRKITCRTEEKLARSDRNGLARECVKLDPRFEKAVAEEELSHELAEWPEY
jgi:hypothetical protein